MKNQITTLFTAITALFIVAIGCKKDKDNNTPPTPKTNTQLITQSPWKYDKTEPSFAEAAIPACMRDNVITFTADGHASSPDIGVICTPSVSDTFDWNFLATETKIHMTAPIIPAGSQDFNIVTLNETNLVVSQSITTPIPATIIVTFKH
jgi:Lipocalin-like domain